MAKESEREGGGQRKIKKEESEDVWTKKQHTIIKILEWRRRRVIVEEEAKMCGMLETLDGIDEKERMYNLM